MKALVLSAAVLVAIPTAANSASLTLGGPLSVLCYEAALTKDSTAEALKACTRALAEEPLTTSDRAATLVNRGVLQMIAGGYREAEKNFDAAIATDPSAADPWLNKAFLRLRQGQGSEALPMLERAMDLRASREALAYLARGLAHEQVGNIRAAYADLRRAQQLDPDWALPAEQLARYEVRSR